MLRVIVIQTAAEISNLEAKHAGKSDRSVSHLDSSFPKRQDSFSYVEERNSDSVEESDDWEDIETFIFALEKAESWVFSRLVESIWWQVRFLIFSCAAFNIVFNQSKLSSKSAVCLFCPCRL